MNEYTRTVLLTRPPDDDDAFVRLLAARGIGVHHFPLIQIVPMESGAESEAAIASIGDLAGIVFTSAHAARIFLPRLRSAMPAAGIVPPIHAVGEKTADAVRACGYTVEMIPQQAHAQGLAESLGVTMGKQFLHPCSDIAREELRAAVEASGGSVRALPVYRTVPVLPPGVARVANLISEGFIECIAFFSPSAVRSFAAAFPSFKQATVLVAAIGQTTAAACLGNGLRVDVIAPEQTGEALAGAIADRFDSAERVIIDPEMHMDIG